MNEEAIQDAYILFTNSGYSKSIEEFQTLLNTNEEALGDAYNLFTQSGYQKSIVEFEKLMGINAEPVKKKDELVLPLDDGSLEQSIPIENIPQEEVLLQPVATSSATDSTLTEPLQAQEIAGTESITPDLMTYEEEFVVPQLNYEYEDQGFTFEQSSGFGDSMIVTADNGETLEVNLDVFRDSTKAEESTALKNFISKNKSRQGLNQMQSDYMSSQKKFYSEKEVDDAIKNISENTLVYSDKVQNYLSQKAELDQEMAVISSLTSEQRREKSEDINQLIQRSEELRGVKNNLVKGRSVLVNNEKNLKVAAGKYFDMLTEQGTVGGASYNAFLKGTGRIAAGTTSYAVDALVSALPFAGMNPNEYRQTFIDLAQEKGFRAPDNYLDMTEKELKNYYSDVSRTEEQTTMSTSGQTIKIGENEITIGEDIEALVYDKAKKSVKYSDDVGMGEGQGLLEAIRNGAVEALGDKGVSEQYDQLMREGFWGGAWLGLMESIPAMIAPGGAPGMAIRTALMFSQVSDHYDEEMDDNPEFKDITENEKAVFKLPVGIVIGALEAVGLRNVLKQTGFLNKILLRIASKTPKNVSGKGFTEVVRNEIDSALARGVLVITAGGVAEFETGALQEVADIGAKEIYNAYKEKEMFVTPQGFAEGVSQVLVAGAQEAVGGFVIGTPGAIIAAANKKDFTQVDDATFKMFEMLTEQDDSSKFTYADYKNKIANPNDKMTKAEAEADIALFEEIQGLVKQIPTDLSTEQKKKALGLMLNRKQLENSKEGKDSSLTKNIDEKIVNIDNQLDNILFTKEAEVAAESIPDMESKDTEVVVEDPNQLFSFQYKSEKEIPDSLKKTEPKRKGKIKINGQNFITLTYSGQQLLDSGLASSPQTKENNLTENQQDIDSFFGEQVDETTETVESNLSINRAGKVTEKSPKNILRENTVIRLAKLGAKSISNLLPKTRIILHETNEEFEKYADPGRAEIIGDTIHVNLSKATSTTIAHEIFHAVFLSKIKTDPRAAKVAEIMMKSVRKTLPNDSELAKRIDSFADSYKDVGELQNEERLAELIGIMSSEYKTLSKPQKNVVVKFIEDLARTLGVELNISEFTKTDEDVINLLNTLASKVRTGQEITEADVEVLEDGTNPIGVPTEIRVPLKRNQLDFKPSYPLSLVTPDKKIDIMSLIKDISSKNQKVWFWVADQLGVGDYNGITLDAGPSYALDGEAVWASSKSKKSIEKNISAADYLFIISGSPQRSLLFNKKVYDVFTQKLGDFNKFKSDALETKPTKNIREVLNNYESWESLRDSPDRKKLLNAIVDQQSKPNTSFHKLIKDKDGFINTEELRDGFYRENSFEINDVMIVIKPTSAREGSQHSTYANEVLGEVVGVPDMKISAFDIMPTEMVEKYQKQLGPSEQSQAVAPYGSGIRKISTPRKKRQQKIETGKSFDLTYKRNPKKAPDLGSTFGQNVEPSGIYITQVEQEFVPQGFESGEIQIQNPLVIDVTNDTLIEYKRDLSKKYNNKKGKALTEAIKNDGYDAVVTKFKEGDTGEIILLNTNINTYKQKIKRQQRSVIDYVTEGREAGFRDELIVDYLRRVRKLKVKEIKEVMDIPMGITMSLPQSFKNIRGGAVAGLKLFKKVDVFRDKERTLNKKRKNKLSEAQIMTKAIEFLQSQPEYKNEGDTFIAKGGKTQFKVGISTQQVLMENDLQKTLDQRPTQDMARRLKLARAMVLQRSKGKRDLQAIKREVRSFIRKTLPADVYSLSEVKSLINEVTEATEENIENVLDKVVDLATTKNNKSLDSKIKKILDNKFITTSYGRKVGKSVDQSTRDRLDAIKKSLANESATGEEIDEVNKNLNGEFNKLLLDPKPSQDVINKMIDIQIAININNAQKLEDNSVYKTEALDTALVELIALVSQGRTLLQQELEKSAKGYRDQMSKVYEAITGQKIDIESEDATEILKKQKDFRVSEREKNEVQKRIRTLIKNTASKIEEHVFGSAEAIDGLMDRIDKLAGDIFGGITQKLVTDKVDASSRAYKSRMLGFDNLLRDTLKEYYGKNWEKKSREFRKNKVEFKDSDGNIKYYTQDQMYYLYNQYKDPASHGAFENMFGKDYAKVMKEVENKLEPEVKQFADWQVDVYFPMVYSHYNETYKKIYRTNMPWNKYYSGRIFRDGIEPTPLDLLANDTVYNTAVGSPSTLLRENSEAEILPMNGTDALITYTMDMEYFAAYAETVRDVNKIFTNQYVKSAIKEIHGEFTYKLIDDMIKKVASKGIRKSKVAWLLNTMNTAFIFARLGLSPVIMIKQLTSIPTYAIDIGAGNWLKYAAKNKTEQTKVWKEVRDNSVYMQDRKNNSILRQIESYSESTKSGFLPSQTGVWLEDFLMWTTKFGDRMAIMLGGLPNYSYYKAEFKKKNPKATEQQAIDHAIIKFERDTKRTQQSSDLQDKDYYQIGDLRAFNMFMTTPKQYLRKEIRNVRSLRRKLMAMDLKAGKGTFTQNATSLLMYHSIMPMLFQFITNGLPGILSDWDDDDSSDLLRAAILGNLNAVIIGGQFLINIADAIQGKPWANKINSIPIIEIVNELQTKVSKVVKADTDQKLEESSYELIQSVATAVGFPANQVKRAMNNYPKLTDSKDFGEFILRLLNYSDYQISGPAKKNTKKKKKKMTQREMKLMFPDLYEEMKEFEDPEFKAIQKELRDLEKEMLEDLYN